MDQTEEDLRKELAERNASPPDATGYSAPYSGEVGCYKDIVCPERYAK